MRNHLLNTMQFKGAGEKGPEHRLLTSIQMPALVSFNAIVYSFQEGNNIT